MNDRRYYPTSDQLLAIEREARRLRAKVIADLFRAGANALRRWVARRAPMPAGGNRPIGRSRVGFTSADLGSGS